MTCVSVFCVEVVAGESREYIVFELTIDADAMGVVALSLTCLLVGLRICMNVLFVLSTKHFAPARPR